MNSAASITRGEAISEGHLGPVVLILFGVALPLGIVGIIGLASTMSANVLARTREFGVMHAIGAPPKTVRRIVVAEGVFLAAASCLVAIIPTLLLTAVLGAGWETSFFRRRCRSRFPGWPPESGSHSSFWGRCLLQMQQLRAPRV